MASRARPQHPPEYKLQFARGQAKASTPENAPEYKLQFAVSVIIPPERSLKK